MPYRFSFIVPFHRGLSYLERCLNALSARPADSELIIAADGATEDCRALAARHGAKLLAIDGPLGPAVARNTAASLSTGEILVFVDADVVVSPSGLARLNQIFDEQPHTAGAFGAYDDHPGDPGFMSQYKNLSHSFIHRSSEKRAHTFWAGFGAIRRDAFFKVGGFDERFGRPTVEDIDLGYRLTGAGYSVVLDPTLSACHLKRCTVRSAILSDIRDRGIPWTQLILRYGALDNDLNLRVEYRWSVALAYLSLFSLALSLSDVRLLAVAAASILAMTFLNRRYYAFFYGKRGASFAARAWLLHSVHHVYNGVSFATGAMLFACARYVRVQLPGALPVDPWSAATPLSAAAAKPAPAWSADPASY
jgi:GT2 family glycosyltransferase